jgi:hypothetical protein
MNGIFWRYLKLVVHMSSLVLFLGVRVDFGKKVEYFVVYSKRICITREVTGVQVLLGISCSTGIDVVYTSLFILVIIGVNNKFCKCISNLDIYLLVSTIKWL